MFASPVSRQKPATARPAAVDATRSCPEDVCGENGSADGLSHGTSVSGNAASSSSKDKHELQSALRSAPFGANAQLKPGAPGAQV